MRSPLVILALAAVVTARDDSSIFYFPEYPPPMTPPSNQTIADSEASLPANETGDDPLLSKLPIHFDIGRYGPAIELAHAYFNYWPTGVGVSSDGRIFTCFPRGNETFTLAQANSSITEAPFPNQEENTPLAFVDDNNPAFSVATDKLLYVQSVVVDSKDRVWALDTGRPRVNGTTLLAATPGGPKLVGFHLNGTRFTTITFPSGVAAPDSSLNDVRFDLRGDGFAYITDSSPQRAGIVVINLTSGKSWRHLDGHPAVLPENGFISIHNGVPTYLHPATPGAAGFFTPVQPSSLNPDATILAYQAVQELGQMGSHANGLESDDQGFIYLSAPEHNAINRFNPRTGRIEPFIRDPLIQWPDTLAVVSLSSGGNFLYFTCNQLWLGPDLQNGTDLRTKPYAMFRVPIEGGQALQT